MFTNLLTLANTDAHAAAAATGEGPIQQILTTFHVNWPHFLAQLATFLIVAFLLKKFAFGPVQAMLEQRRTRIADGENKLKQIEQQLAASEKSTAELIAKANADAKRMIDEAKASASALTEQKAQEAVAQAQGIIAKAEAAARAERAQISADLKREFGRLVATTAQQATGGKLSDEQQRQINEESLTRVQA
jgi:F-type H+-transporting ATPase subunit b